MTAYGSDMEMGSNLVQALVLATIWLAVILAAQGVLRYLFDRYQRRLAKKDKRTAARRGTMFDVLRRAAMVFLVLIGTWSVLSVFPATSAAAKAFLASSAALALILGLALTTPVGNIGSGILLGLTQPLRVGDRITLHMDRGDEHTGVVERIALTYTTLVTDEGRKIFVPNLAMVRNVVVNHSRGDRRKIVSIRLPVDISAPLDDACRMVVDAAHEAADEVELDVTVTDVEQEVVWLEIEGFAPASADVPRITTEVRKRALTALAEEELLPAGRRVAERTR